MTLTVAATPDSVCVAVTVVVPAVAVAVKSPVAEIEPTTAFERVHAMTLLGCGIVPPLCASIAAANCRVPLSATTSGLVFGVTASDETTALLTDS